MHEVIDLDGVYVARARVQDGTPLLQIMSASGFTEDKVYFPAESVTVDSPEAVEKLRDLLSNMLDEMAATRSQAPLPDPELGVKL